MWYQGFLKKALFSALLSFAVGAVYAANGSSSIYKDRSSTSFTKTSKKVVRFLTPWTNTSAILYVNGDSAAVMHKIDNYCGWFEAKADYSNSGLSVSFKQTIGNKYYGAEGVVNSKVDIGSEISLDSVAALADTIWVRSYQWDAPQLFTQYPGVLGDCPTKKLPVMMFDWYDGSYKNVAKYHPETRSAALGGTTVRGGTGISSDFGGDNVHLCWPTVPAAGQKGEEYEGFDYRTEYAPSIGKSIQGMVESTLGPNGVPVRNESFDWAGSCRNAEYLNHWFIPETLVVKNGISYTNAACRDLTLILDDDGIWRGQMDMQADSSTGEKLGGMFLLDDFQYLDSAKTIPNPHYDSIPNNDAGDGTYHNYGISMKVQAKFEYVRGQYFEFLGDDDVWVFINNKLVVDIGGVHDRRNGAVDLDTLGLVEGKEYTFHIFYTERYKYQGNFKMRTSMDLKTEASLILVSDIRDNIKNYDIWQANKKEALSCDFSANALMDTTGGHSTYKLSGGSLAEPENLDIGVWYEGINITSDTTFSIDSAAIAEHYALSPGHYFIEITLKSDPSQTQKVEFVVPPYSIPSIAFADSSWKILGNEVSGDTLQIGKLAYEIYPVHISFLEEWAQVNNYNKKVNLTVSDTLIDILDASGSKISTVSLDSDGHATFYLRANGEVSNATLTAQGAAATASHWVNLKFELPPIPQVVAAKIFDRNGDGRGDSLHVKFDRVVGAGSTLDSLQFKFGENFPVYGASRIVVNGDEVIVTSNANCAPETACGFGSKQFTGGESEIYTGSMTTWFTYVDSDRKSYHFQIANTPVEDHIGPIILAAESQKNNSGERLLSLTFSEAISDSTRAYYASMFEFTCNRNGTSTTPDSPITALGHGSTMTLVYAASINDDAIPTSGDLIRFAPEWNLTCARDLSNNAPHLNNPWVFITGEQSLSVESPNLVTISAENPIIANTKTTQPILITDNSLTAQQIGDSLGVQGNLIDFDIYKVIQEETQKEISALDAYIDKLIVEAEDDTVYSTSTIGEAEALKQLFDDIASGIVTESYGISATVIEAVQTGALTSENYKSSSLLTALDIAAIDNLKQKNIDESRQTNMTIIPASNVTTSDIFAAIVSGAISESDLLSAGISKDVISAIKDGTITADNISSYRTAEQTLMSADQVTLAYTTRYYSHLGHYIDKSSGTISCSTAEVYGEGGCAANKGRLFLAWNMRSKSGRLVGTGVYIARLHIKLYVAGQKKMDMTMDKSWGVRR